MILIHRDTHPPRISNHTSNSRHRANKTITQLHRAIDDEDGDEGFVPGSCREGVSDPDARGRPRLNRGIRVVLAICEQLPGAAVLGLLPWARLCLEACSPRKRRHFLNERKKPIYYRSRVVWCFGVGNASVTSAVSASVTSAGACVASAVSAFSCCGFRGIGRIGDGPRSPRLRCRCLVPQHISFTALRRRLTENQKK